MKTGAMILFAGFLSFEKVLPDIVSKKAVSHYLNYLVTFEWLVLFGEQ